MIRFALFGAGFIGQVHGANIATNPRTKLQYVYDVNDEAAQKLAGRFGARVAASVDEVWAAPDVDAVLIASSTNTHADLLRSAIQHGKPVYCEKPIDMSLERVKAVVQLAHDRPVPIMMGFSRRFDPNHRALRAAVQGGEVGVVEMINMVCRSSAPPPLAYIKVSGGQFRDQTIHMFDLLCWIAGKGPVEVYACGSSMMDPAITEAGDVDTPC
jgi:myo-inositol 2-dehydrogenase/D-chiro-inositol 1-dehydrogenase